VVNEQNPPSAEFALFGGGRVKAWFLRQLYPRADRVTAISTGIARELVSSYGLPQDKVQVIPNPVDLVRVRTLAAARLEHPFFPAKNAGRTASPGRGSRPGRGWSTGQSGLPVLSAVGRLHPQKGFTYLIRAFSIVRQALPCKLVILGEGPLRKELEGLIASLGLVDDIVLPGFQENPYNYVSNSAVFVLSSLFEGFGNVLVDALALGVPVVSTRCPVGPEDIITDGVTGIFVPPADEQALAQAILRVLQDSELRRRLSANGPLRAADFAIERIVPQYEALFECLSRQPRQIRGAQSRQERGIQ
jgi:glycosyltransferase involved in cell wall biosynthesis